MSDQQDDPTAEVEHGKVTKYLWLLLIFPIGLIIGTVTSTCNHLKHDQSKDEMAQYRVSEEIHKHSLVNDLENAFATPKQDPRITLKGISSSNGLNHYLKLRKAGEGLGTLGYYDVMAEEKENQGNIIALVMQLDEPDAVARAAMISINIAVMKSVFGETNFKHTLRFVFLPNSKTNLAQNPEILTMKGEKLVSYYIMQPLEHPKFEKVEWLELEDYSMISHPALDRRAENILTDQQINLTFQAAKQLRVFLLEKL